MRVLKQCLYTCLASIGLQIVPAGASETGTVLITGANRGIGLELARQYADDGWTVIGTARRPAAADELQDLDVNVVQLDVTDPDSVDRMAKSLAGRDIDVLINNAGVLIPMDSLADIDIEAFERTMAVNTVGPVRVTQALLPNLQAGDMKKIVNISSQAGSLRNNTHAGLYGYRESKVALNMFTRSLAAEFGPDGFIAIVVHPGWVQTDMGGAEAAVPVTKSAAGIRKVIASLSDEENGSFKTYTGDTLPW